MTCTNSVCGTGGWNGPKPGDPDNQVTLSATVVYGGVEVSWTYPMINPHAVIHTLLYRGVTSVWENAQEPLVIAGNYHFYPTIVAEPPQYYYWIHLVSINGTRGGLIGPVTVQANTRVADLISALSQEINDSYLSQELRQKIEKIAVLEGNIAQETNNRLDDLATMGYAVNDLQQAYNDAMTYLNSEHLERVTDASELAGILEQMSVTSAQNAADEAQARADAIAAEAQARGQALAQEVDNRADAIAAVDAQIRAAFADADASTLATIRAEMTSGNIDISSMVSQYTYTKVDIDSALAAQASDIIASMTTADSAVLAEAKNFTYSRTAIDAADAATLSTVRAEMASGDTTTLASAKDYTYAKATIDSSIATSATSLRSQITGGYTGTDLNAIASGLLYQERITRANAVESLSQQITAINAGSGEQFDYQKIWYFDADAENWTADTANNTAITVVGGWIRMAATSGTQVRGYLSPDNLNVDGAKYTQVRIRIKKVGTPTWKGKLYFITTTNTMWDEDKVVSMGAEPALDSNGITVLTVNMPASWSSATIRRIRLDMSTNITTANYYELDWVAIGRPSPGASSAQLLEEQLARTTADSALVQANETLSVQLRGTYEGNDLASVSSGLLASEKLARLSADESEVTARTTLGTKVLGAGDPEAKTLANLSAGLLYEERQARSNADSTEVTKREALSAKMTGFADPAGKTLAQLTSGLVFDEREARVTADGANALLTQGVRTDLNNEILRIDSNAQSIGIMRTDISTIDDKLLITAEQFNIVQARLESMSTAVFSEKWGNASSLNDWQVMDGAASERSIVAVSGSNVLRVGNNAGNDNVWFAHKKLIPYDPAKTYRTKIRVRRTAGTGTVYLGWLGIAADGVTPVTTAGDTGTSSAHYHTASNVAPPNTFNEYVGYTKGASATGAGDVGTKAMPSPMHPDVVFMRPYLVLNYDNAAGTMEVDSVLVEDVSDMLATEALIVEERLARVNEDFAQTQARQDLESTINGKLGGKASAQSVIDVSNTVTDLNGVLLGVSQELTSFKSTVGDNQTAVQNQIQAITSPTSTYAVAIDQLSGRIGDNAALIQSEKTLLQNADQAIVQRIDNQQIVDGKRFGAVEQKAVTTLEKVDGVVTKVNSAWFAKVQVDDLIGGFAIGNDGRTVEAGFDVDRFWVGKSAAKTKPFIIDDGVVYINKAMIKQLTADQIDTRGLTIKDADGIVIFGSGTGMPWSQVTGADKPASGATRNEFRGPWLTATAYSAGDIIIDSDGYGWSCKLLHTSGPGNKPPVYPANSSTFWDLFIVRGQDAVIGMLSNESASLAADAAGVVTAETFTSFATGTFHVYKGPVRVGATLPTYSVVSQTNCTGTITTAGVYKVTELTQDTGSITYKAEYDGTFIERTFTLSKSRIGSTGANGTDGKSVSLSGSTLVFQEDNAGVVTPASTVLTAVGLGVAGSPVFSVTNGTATLTGTGNTRTLAVASLTTPQATIKLTWDGLEDSVTVYKVSSGADGITVVLSNEAHLLPAASTGVVSSYVGSGTTIQVYEGNTLLNAATTNAKGTFKTGVPTQLPASTITVGAISYAGTTITVANHAGMVNATDLVSLTFPITVYRANGTSTVINKVQTIGKAKAGSTGSTGGIGPKGSDGVDGSAIVLTPNRPATFTATDGNLDGSQSNIVFTAAVLGVPSPTYVWSFTGLQSTPASTNTNTFTITAAQFGNSKAAMVTCTVNDTFTDKVSIMRLERSSAAAGATVGADWSQNIANKPSNSMLLSNLIDPSTWAARTHGSQPGFAANGGVFEQFIDEGTLPDGSIGTMWRCYPGLYYNNAYGWDGTQPGGTPAGDADGGWDTDFFPVDAGKTYRFSVWVQRSGNATGGTYLGCNTNAPGGGVMHMPNNIENTNPYFWNGALPADDRWYLVVGYVRPSSAVAHGQANRGGVWDGTTGAKVLAGSDYAWHPATTMAKHRAYLYYATSSTAQFLAWPRVDLCDGSEPTLQMLLASGAVSAANPITHANASTYIANAAIGAAQIGSIALTGIGNFSVKSAGAGQRMEMDSRYIKIFDTNGVLRVQLGDLGL